MKYYLDTEFFDSREKAMSIVCLSISDESGLIREFWTYEDEDLDEVTSFFSSIEGSTLVAFQATAEVRSLLSLNIDPRKYKWIDLFSEWVQLLNKNDTFLIKEDKSFRKKNLIECTEKMIGIKRDSEFKDDTRDLILSGGPYTPEERQRILFYCSDDIKHLANILKAMQDYYKEVWSHEIEDIEPVMLNRGNYICALGICENEGIPMDIPQLRHLNYNYTKVIRSVIEDMNETFHLYELAKKPKKDPDRPDRWIFRQKNFQGFIEHLGMTSRWPRTPSGHFSTAEDDIQKFRGIEAVEQLYQCRKTIKSMQSIDPEKKDGLWNNIGKDGRVRPYFGQFGTQTGRNAPKAKAFPLAMAHWMRHLMVPPKGYEIFSVDYGSQEFALAASMSEDPNMIEAYNSGDPYFYFAKMAGAVPMDAERKDHEEIRNLFKATVLGLQYGMGVDKLQLKLEQDTGEKVDRLLAYSLIAKHKRIFKGYWKYLDEMSEIYKKNGLLKTKDNWILFGNNPNFLSVRNFPIQGTGASVLREVMIQCMRKGIKTIAPLHDGVYFLIKKDDEDAKKEILDIMSNATTNFTELPVRMDTESYYEGKDWLYGKSLETYRKIESYIY